MPTVPRIKARTPHNNMRMLIVTIISAPRAAGQYFITRKNVTMNAAAALKSLIRFRVLICFARSGGGAEVFVPCALGAWGLVRRAVVVVFGRFVELLPIIWCFCYKIGPSVTHSNRCVHHCG